MIRLAATARAHLSRSRRYALDVLIDLSRLLPATEDVEHAIPLEILFDDAPVGLSGLGAGSTWLIEDGRVGIPVLALDLITDIAGAAIEQRAKDRDRHDRVPATSNPLVIAGLERAPVVSQAAVALRRAVIEAAGRRPVFLAQPWPGGHRWAALMTHDVDVVNWWPAFTALRLAELGRKLELRRGARVLSAAVASALADPIRTGVARVLEAERARSIPGTWFFLTGTPTIASVAAGDITYAIESPRARAIIAAVREAGHEIGLHGSFATYASGPRFRQEREHLAAQAAGAITGVRQHYLRMSPGDTQRAMAAAGFTYDASYGFSSRNGFRLGVADVVQGWDMREDEPSGVEELPLIWMDRALSKYAGVEDPRAWITDASHLMAAAAAVDGLWVGLWHPNLTAPLGFPGAEEAFRQLLDAMRDQNPWIATAEQAVRFRRARRTLRVEQLSPSGIPRVVHSASSAEDLAVEDAQGRPVEISIYRQSDRD